VKAQGAMTKTMVDIRIGKDLHKFGLYQYTTLREAVRQYGVEYVLRLFNYAYMLTQRAEKRQEYAWKPNVRRRKDQSKRRK